jgi:KaiC/GvpD/RAD55 family RecA-like ATPase
LSSPERVNVPLLARLIPGGVRPATIFGVEFDPESQWFAVATTIAAKTLLQNRYVSYLAMARPLDNVLQELSALGVNVAAAFKSALLEVIDWYSATLTGGRLGTGAGQEEVFEQIEEGVSRIRSLKVADLSLHWLKQMKSGPEIYEKARTGEFGFVESCSSQLRFNEEKPYVEWMESRVNPEERRLKNITFQGFVRGVHSEWVYRRMEADWDGVIDVRVMDEGGEAKSFLRMRSLKGLPYDGRWHEIEIKPNGEAVLNV